MGIQVRPFHELLQGEHAFYNDKNYAANTVADFQRIKPLPPSFTWNSQSTAMRIVKLILSIVIFPIGIALLLHAAVGLVVVPSTHDRSALRIRQLISTQYLDNTRWKYKRFTVECDGLKIDAMLIGKPKTLDNGRFMLASLGNGQLYEQQLYGNNDIKNVMESLGSNGVVFNYSGVGASSGLPNRAAMAKAYRAMLKFLEDKKDGIGAKEIIGYGHSIGGGVQAEGLKGHELSKEIKYVFIKSRTFSSICKTFESIIGSRILGWFPKLFGWNINSVESSKSLLAPEIIMQSRVLTEKEDVEWSLRKEEMGWRAELTEEERLATRIPLPTSVMTDPARIRDDGVIFGEASLAKSLLEEDVQGEKIILGIPEDHNAPLSGETLYALAGHVNRLLAEQHVEEPILVD